MIQSLKRIAESKWFQNATLGIILIAGILAGLETSSGLTARHGNLLDQLDRIVLGFFTLELLIKMGSRGGRWWKFFADPWNLFDFLIVGVCYLPMDTHFAVVLRLVRVLRVLRLVSNLPRLQIIVGALLKSIPSMGYVGLLLLLHFYIFGVMGNSLFGRNDPVNFGTLPRAMVSLFEVVTLEGWVDLMNIQVHGSDKFGYDEFKDVVREPSASPVLAVAYFFSFIMLGTMIILNLLIGVIVGGIQEAQEEREAGERARNVEQTGLPSAQDELNQAVRQLEDLKKQLDVIRRRLSA